MPLLFLFLDGVGLGEADPKVNPFAAASTPWLSGLLGGPLTRERTPRAGEILFRGIDATLEFPGLPQSATGQTTLLTGHNGADLMRGHYGPWPGPTLKRLLDAGTLFSQTHSSGQRCAFANAYPEGYFRALRGGKQRVNVPVYAARGAGVRLRTTQDYARGNAIGGDLTGAYFHGMDPALPLHTPEEAGVRLAEIARDFDLTFFDFWLSDAAGHRWSFGEATALVSSLDAFLSGVLGALGDATLLITSDHGNVEDKRVKTHTMNPVPLIAVGPGRDAFAEVTSLLGVAPAVRTLLGLPQV